MQIAHHCRAMGETLQPRAAYEDTSTASSASCPSRPLYPTPPGSTSPSNTYSAKGSAARAAGRVAPVAANAQSGAQARTWRRIHSYMAMPLATPALIERVEPY